MNYETLNKKVFDLTVTTTKQLSYLENDLVQKTIASKISEKAIVIWETFNSIKDIQDTDTKIYKIEFIIRSLDLYYYDMQILISSISQSDIKSSLIELGEKANELKNEFSELLEQIKTEMREAKLQKKRKRFPYLGIYSLIVFVISVIFFQLTEGKLFAYMVFLSIVGIVIQILITFFRTDD